MHPLTAETHERVIASLPPWWQERSLQGLAAFEKLEMPDPREEVWRYVDLDVDITDFRLPLAAGDPMGGDDSILGVLGDVAGHAVSVDGVTMTADGDDAHVTVASMAGAGDLEGLAAAMTGGVPADLDIFAAAHQAFGTDGVVIAAGAGRAIERPVLVDMQVTVAGSIALPRLVVIAHPGSEVWVVAHLRSPDGVPILALPQFDLVTGANARVGLTVVQQWGDQTVAAAQHRLRAGRDAFVELDEAGMGGQFSRLHLTIDLEGRGADARVLGAHIGDGDRTLDYRAFVNHAAPNTTSEMFLKGAVGDTAKSVFTGLIRIEPEGQRSNAHQTNRNLVLSEGAEAHSVPNLEILANDVRCGHGSAVGPLDEEQRYYLMSRGLDRARADRLQVKGFFEQVLTRFRHRELEPRLRQEIMSVYDGIVGREPT